MEWLEPYVIIQKCVPWTACLEGNLHTLFLILGAIAFVGVILRLVYFLLGMFSSGES